jgi:hypothetical protein
MFILDFYIEHHGIATGEAFGLLNGSLLPAEQLCEHLRQCTDKVVVASDAAANSIKLKRTM